MNEKKLSAVENYIIGALTGLAEVLLTNPFFVIKTKVQQNKSWVLTPMDYYKGSFANALGFMPITAMQVGVNEWVQAKFFNNNPTYAQQIGSAFMAGVSSSFISCPVEMTMILQNDNAKSNLAKILHWQCKNKGLSSFFVGQLATSLREGGFSVCFLVSPPLIKFKLKSCGLSDLSSSVLAGVASGVAATLITQPVDTIKTTQQSNMDLKLGFFKTAKNMTMVALFKGIVARSSSLILSITLMDLIKAQLENMCKKYGESRYYEVGLKK